MNLRQVPTRRSEAANGRFSGDRGGGPGDGQIGSSRPELAIRLRFLDRAVWALAAIAR
jgi:hypothetical protein